MNVSPLHILSQGKVLSTLARTALQSMLGHKAGGTATLPATPGPEIVELIPPRPGSLIDDYIRHVGGEVRAYRDQQ